VGGKKNLFFRPVGTNGAIEQNTSKVQ